WPHDAAIDGFFQRPLDCRGASRHLLIVHIDENDLEAFGRHFLGDTAAHVTGADDGEDADLSSRHDGILVTRLTTTEDTEDTEDSSPKQVPPCPLCPLWWRIFSGRKYDWRL